jgi:hypothetical protein
MKVPAPHLFSLGRIMVLSRHAKFLLDKNGRGGLNKRISRSPGSTTVTSGISILSVREMFVAANIENAASPEECRAVVRNDSKSSFYWVAEVKHLTVS